MIRLKIPYLVLFLPLNPGEDYTKRKGTTVKFLSSGKVALNTFGKDTTFCAMNLKYFPFDKHTCSMEFTHWVRFGLKYLGTTVERQGIEFRSQFGALLMLSRENEEWNFLNIRLVTKTIEFSMSDNASITFPKL